MENQPLDFDYQSTTPCSKGVVRAMQPYWNEFWANPSDRQNRSGLHMSASIGLARDKLANCLGVKPERLIFTSGATEANNLALLGYSRAKAIEIGNPGHVITISTEHHAVLDPLKQLKREGFRVTQLVPDSEGILSSEKLIEAFQDDTFLVSIMLANNEIGVIQSLEDFSKLCQSRGIVLHSDAAQAFGYLPINVEQMGIDYLSISGHKIYGPKGIGALVIRESFPIQPLIWGGGQENGIRAGTLPVPLVIGFAEAASIAINDLSLNNKKLTFLRDKLWNDLQSQIPDLIVNGSLDRRLPHNLNFTILGITGSRLKKRLRPFINYSSASACSNGSPSHVLMAIGRTMKEAESSLRLSIGREMEEKDINSAVSVIKKAVNELRA